ncbi:aminotransferase class I/II-fold pyridoxal phosphate-dependent enzyme [Hydrogenimonas thermophila]|uniref:trans-sulfuration enzyme family protein n=1 Tax=Hydrogenimonas thermophila TaxID=223786 RepID=UPI002937021E|nr:aminotransferase class I/II-fold pyridoxal phosphate-dependent enzyme [Hydrogenimonas thermophila]WOE70373.1 aminotransferase class I/II-fold pyridoxal phosphate-dependent enzyme [Hydrogenimonas thermophila]WOE72888.1 aminotransferase class I/II-fold pyridoxal phosphate-dependent enzyme [Hydrogenimonas thermophila]
MEKYEYFNTLLPQIIGLKKGAIAPQITPSAAFGYASAEEAESIFSGEAAKPLYARMGNPTGAKLETVLAKMEGGQGAVVTSSGMAAITMVLTAFLQSGDKVLCIGGFFGGTYALMNDTLPRFGIEGIFCDVDDYDGIEKALQSGVKMVLCESVGNPNLKLPNLREIAGLCDCYNALFVVDNTVTPLIVEPFKMGADLVVYSTTKIISGHSAALGGAVVFRAVKDSDEKLLDSKFSAIHPILKKGKGALMMVLKKRAMRDFGMSANAFASFLTLLGLETLPLRTKRVNESVEKLVRLLDEAGVNVRHPNLETHEHHLRYKENFSDGCGPIVTIDCGTKEKAFTFLNESKLITQTANIGDNRTLGLHMASTIYRDFNEDEKRRLGITDGLVRLSIGLESPDELAKDMILAWKSAQS